MFVDIPTDILFDLNKYTNALKSRSRYGWVMKHNSTLAVQHVLEKAIQANPALFEQFSDKFRNEETGLVFEWHVNKRKDPDNVSSAGRKAILDGFQQAKLSPDRAFLDRDSLKFVKGFVDLFITDNGGFVRISPYNIKFTNDMFKIDTD